MLDSDRLDENTIDACHKLLLKSGEPYCVPSAIDKVVQIFWDGVITSVSIDSVRKLPTGPRALQPSATTGGEAQSRATTTEAAIGVWATVQDSRGTGPVKEDKEKYVIEKFFEHHQTETGMQYRARWNGCDSSEYT